MVLNKRRLSEISVDSGRLEGMGNEPAGDERVSGNSFKVSSHTEGLSSVMHDM